MAGSWIRAGARARTTAGDRSGSLGSVDVEELVRIEQRVAEVVPIRRIDGVVAVGLDRIAANFQGTHDGRGLRRLDRIRSTEEGLGLGELRRVGRAAEGQAVGQADPTR